MTSSVLMTYKDKLICLSIYSRFRNKVNQHDYVEFWGELYLMNIFSLYYYVTLSTSEFYYLYVNILLQLLNIRPYYAMRNAINVLFDSECRNS